MPIISKLYKLIQIRKAPLKSKLVVYMNIVSSGLYNPKKHYLSKIALNRLEWIKIIEEDCNGNISKASRKIGISREWLNKLHSLWLKKNKDPRSLEPKSRQPKNTSNRKRLNTDVWDKVTAIRKKFPAWGKEKISRLILTQFKIQVSGSSVGRCLKKHSLVHPKLSEKNKLAWKNKVINQQIKQRPPIVIKDYKPGGLVEKDMKFIVKQGVLKNTVKYKAKENYYLQHTLIDDFTRIRVLDVVRNSSSSESKKSFLESIKRFPFPVACVNTDNGGENRGEFEKLLTEKNIVHFFSKVGTPTDNPRVERSHLTDDIEFFNQGNRNHKIFEDLKSAQMQWEQIYNFVRPHQALSYLSPMQFYELWKKDPKTAYGIRDKWKTYLAKQSKKQNNHRRIKKKEKIEALMHHIDNAVENQEIQLLNV